MPEITILGWIHTAAGILALIAGLVVFAKDKVIQFGNVRGKIYLVATLVTAVTALFIFQFGKFNIAHALAILTLLALVAGFVCEHTNILGKFTDCFQALSYSATFLFHMIPAITDGLRRLPIDDPVVNDINDPLLKKFYLAFLVAFVIGVTLQIRWLKRRS